MNAKLVEVPLGIGFAAGVAVVATSRPEVANKTWRELAAALAVVGALTLVGMVIRLLTDRRLARGDYRVTRAWQMLPRPGRIAIIASWLCCGSA